MAEMDEKKVVDEVVQEGVEEQAGNASYASDGNVRN